MAHKKGQGSTRNGRDSRPKFLGVKRTAGQAAQAASILFRSSESRENATDRRERSELLAQADYAVMAPRIEVLAR